jgi:hypothetical protein
MESLKLKRFHGIVKVSGIVLCAAGVTVLALYQGPKLKSFVRHLPFHHANRVDIRRASIWETSCLQHDIHSASLGFGIWACQSLAEIRLNILGHEQLTVLVLAM